MVHLIKDEGSGTMVERRTSVLWKEVCLKESLWIKCKERQLKQVYKVNSIQTRKEFDKHVQRSKQIHWFKMQTAVLEDLDNDPKELWKTIGKVGISNCQNKLIPVEVVSEGGQIENDTDAVLERWKSDFSALYNRPRSQ